MFGPRKASPFPRQPRGAARWAAFPRYLNETHCVAGVDDVGRVRAGSKGLLTPGPSQRRPIRWAGVSFHSPLTATRLRAELFSNRAGAGSEAVGSLRGSSSPTASAALATADLAKDLPPPKRQRPPKKTFSLVRSAPRVVDALVALRPPFPVLRRLTVRNSALSAKSAVPSLTLMAARGRP